MITGRGANPVKGIWPAGDRAEFGGAVVELDPHNGAIAVGSGGGEADRGIQGGTGSIQRGGDGHARCGIGCGAEAPRRSGGEVDAVVGGGIPFIVRTGFESRPVE